MGSGLSNHGGAQHVGDSRGVAFPAGALSRLRRGVDRRPARAPDDLPRRRRRRDRIGGSRRRARRRGLRRAAHDLARLLAHRRHAGRPQRLRRGRSGPPGGARPRLDLGLRLLPLPALHDHLRRLRPAHAGLPRHHALPGGARADPPGRADRGCVRPASHSAVGCRRDRRRATRPARRDGRRRFRAHRAGHARGRRGGPTRAGRSAAPPCFSSAPACPSTSAPR